MRERDWDRERGGGCPRIDETQTYMSRLYICIAICLKSNC